MFTIPNLLTAANLNCGIAAILLIQADQIDIALICLIGSLIFDLFDGYLARLLNQQSDLGVQLDSFADLISFGLAPSFFLYYQCKEELGLWATVCFIMCLLAAFRLARFNVKTDGLPNDFEGMPSPMAALFVMGLFILPDHFNISILVYPTTAIGLGICMVSTFPVLKFKPSLAWAKKHPLLIFLIVGSIVSSFYLKSLSLSLLVIGFSLYSLTKKNKD